MKCVLSFNDNDLRPFRETLEQMVWVSLTQINSKLDHNLIL